MRTRLRRLHVDGQAFTWRAGIHHAPGSGDCHRCIRVRAWVDDKTRQALQADLLSLTWPAPWGACTTDGAYPTLADVRAVILYGLAHGWQPERRGGTFTLTERDHAAHFTLPGFLLTDRLHTPDSDDPTTRVINAHERRRYHQTDLTEPE
ncbi:integrase [Pseudofrankia asymbiotica]|uniref:Integrase n=1 Tax=Pseudofrankia asymbiotica TaxID=1834516 RepID=A0A1V2I1K1_9ACTN|nr:integrase [Pseudofrankia asymbiotica]ONH22199.1 integrase [Pseudofrankia asymbiotica]